MRKRDSPSSGESISELLQAPSSSLPFLPPHLSLQQMMSSLTGDGGGGGGWQQWQGTVVSVGIFVGTVLVTTTATVTAGGGWTHRWQRRRWRRQQEQASSSREQQEQQHDHLDRGARQHRPTIVPPSNNLDHLYDGRTAGTEGESDAGPYAYRRLEDRLSFHEHDDGHHTTRRTHHSQTHPSDITQHNNNENDNDNDNDNNADPAGGDDFYPMNANWSHFDLTALWRRHEDGDQTTSSALPVVQRQTSLEGDRVYQPSLRPGHCPGDRASGSSDAATAKAAQFVWTTAAVHPKPPKKEPNLVPAAGSATSGPTAPSHASKEDPVRSSERIPVVSKSPLHRAESLDDRTVWGDRTASSSNDPDPSFPLPTSRLPFHQTSTTSTTTTTNSYITDTDASPLNPFQGDPTDRAASSPHRLLAPRRTRSASVAADSVEGPPTAATASTTTKPYVGYDRDLAAAVRRQNAKARAAYNARIMPHAVILVRHGQSLGNTNEALYATVPDNAMPLTELGWEQARAAGRTLKKLLNDKNHNPHFVVSPYVRTVETFHGMASAWCDPADFKHITDRDARLAAWYSRLLALGLTWHEDPRIREQDFGNYQNASIIRQAKQDRHRFGAFYYRFPHGESASDVFDRISTFLDSLWRSFDVHRSRVYVLVTHGIAIRVLLSRYFRYTIAQFGMLANPRNGEMVVLRHDGHGRLRLAGRYELELEEPRRPSDVNTGDDEDDDPGGDETTGTDAGGDPKVGKTHVVGVSFHERLRVLPPEYIRKVPIRISFDDEDND